MKKGDLLFVYGTLRRGESADLSVGQRGHKVLFVGKDAINGLLYNLGYYPGIKEVTDAPFSPDLPVVVGDVFTIGDESITEVLDAYEGYPSLYGREVVQSQKGRSVWVYTYNHEVADSQRILNGDWQSRRDVPIQSGYTPVAA
jgi:gamma-glutamylcyclotransferase (GGCT)/AIG2-like uncharacterized protein YtfP